MTAILLTILPCLQSCAPALLAFTSLRQALTHRTLQANVAVRGDTRQGDDRGRPSCTERAGDEPSDHHWSFRPSQPGSYRVQVHAMHDVVVAINANDQELVCDDDSNGVAASQFTFEFAANREYTIVIDGYRGEAGPYELLIAPTTQRPAP